MIEDTQMRKYGVTVRCCICNFDTECRPVKDYYVCAQCEPRLLAKISTGDMPSAWEMKIKSAFGIRGNAILSALEVLQGRDVDGTEFERERISPSEEQ